MAKHKRKSKGGRPRSSLPPEIEEQLGPPPVDQPLRLARWYQNAIALLTWHCAKGEPLQKLLESMRASAGAAGRVLAHDILYEAHRILNDNANSLKNTSDVRPVKREDAPANGHSKASRREV